MANVVVKLMDVGMPSVFCVKSTGGIRLPDGPLLFPLFQTISADAVQADFDLLDDNRQDLFDRLQIQFHDAGIQAFHVSAVAAVEMGMPWMIRIGRQSVAEGSVSGTEAFHESPFHQHIQDVRPGVTARFESPSRPG